MNLDELRNFCHSLPGTVEDVKWGADLCFNVGDKMYCITGFEHPVGMSLKTTPEKFEELTQHKSIRPAAYLARYHWVRIEDASAFPTAELKEWIAISYSLVVKKLPKKQRDLLPEL
jgi:predicted DNA-binding protein (MmcQ/YjbR family)